MNLLNIGDRAIGTTSIPGGRTIEVAGTVYDILSDGTHLLRPSAEAQATEGLTDQAIGYGPHQIRRAS